MREVLPRKPLFLSLFPLGCGAKEHDLNLPNRSPSILCLRCLTFLNPSFIIRTKYHDCPRPLSTLSPFPLTIRPCCEPCYLHIERVLSN
ncbi:hypothetical protein DFH28DRAFT_953839 [Melampsora americana]|nr:hypothetical protein DFH28DRAFT_953839 [Melampsora americana]